MLMIRTIIGRMTGMVAKLDAGIGSEPAGSFLGIDRRASVFIAFLAVLAAVKAGLGQSGPISLACVPIFFISL